MARDLRAVRDVELALHVPVVGDTVAPFMASARDTDPAALREADSLAVLPDDPAAAAEEIQRRREEIGYSYFVFGADSAEVLAPMVASWPASSPCGPGSRHRVSWRREHQSPPRRGLTAADRRLLGSFTHSSAPRCLARFAQPGHRGAGP